MPLPTLFGWVGWFTVGAAVVLALLIKPTARLVGREVGGLFDVTSI